MSANQNELAKEQIKSGVTVLLNQFEVESDLDEMQIVASVVKALNEWLEDELIEFIPD